MYGGRVVFKNAKGNLIDPDKAEGIPKGKGNHFFPDAFPPFFIVYNNESQPDFRKIRMWEPHCKMPGDPCIIEGSHSPDS